MAEYTENYNLEKQEGNDNVDISGINNNFDIIDAEIKNAQDRANQAFQSASEGKQKIATAITGKGVPTSSSDTFSTMADNIEAIETDPSIGTTNAVPADVLAPKKVVSQGQLFEGTMSNRGPVGSETINLTEQNQEYTIAQGFHSGLRKIKASIAGLTANVIKAGTTVGGILGTFTSDATAAAADILSGKSGYVDGIKVNGNMSDRGTINQTLTQQNQEYTVAAGKHSGSGKVKVTIPNLTPENLKDGVNAGGIIGTYNNEGFQLELDNIGTNQMFGADPSIGMGSIEYVSKTTPFICEDLLVYQGTTGQTTIEPLDFPMFVRGGSSYRNTWARILPGASISISSGYRTILNLSGGRIRVSGNTNGYYCCISKPN